MYPSPWTVWMNRGCPGSGLDLLPQPRHRVIDRTGLGHVRVAPDLLQQVRPLHDAAVLGEVAEEGELAVREVEVGPVARGLHRGEVDDDLAEGQPVAARARAAEHGADARQQFFQVERLGDVVVGAEVEALQLVGLLRARRQHDDGRLAPFPQEPHQFEAVAAGEHDVEHDEVRGEVAGGRDGQVPVAHALDVEAVVDEVVPQHARQRRIVFNDQDPLLHRLAPPPGSRSRRSSPRPPGSRSRAGRRGPPRSGGRSPARGRCPTTGAAVPGRTSA